MPEEKTDNVVKKFKTAEDMEKDFQNTQHEIAMTKVRRNARKIGIPMCDAELEENPALLERSLSSDFSKFGNV